MSHPAKSRITFEQGKVTVVVVGTYQRESHKAICVEMQEGSFWLPKSQFSREPLYPQGGDTLKDSSIICFVPRWLAEKNDINWSEYVEEDYPAEESDDDGETGGWQPPVPDDIPPDDGFDDIPF